MVKTSKYVPKNIIYIILSIVIIAVVLYILYTLFKKNKNYESFANPCNDPNDKSCSKPPSTSYRNTCNNINFSNGNINAKCKNICGDYVNNKFDSNTCDNIIENCNGTLTCGKCPTLSNDEARKCSKNPPPSRSECPHNQPRCPDGKCPPCRSECPRNQPRCPDGKCPPCINFD